MTKNKMYVHQTADGGVWNLQATLLCWNNRIIRCVNAALALALALLSLFFKEKNPRDLG